MPASRALLPAAVGLILLAGGVAFHTFGSAESDKARPGLVPWHADFAAAGRASAESGKPRLLLQLVGELDTRFC